ncbi:4353_t:CDS:1 [Racocetra persica]|uniref:4353_t:CDS:1 n=1 Tax=Racocetra persica TaxID=160502 RepID=A0ACA9QLU3_9GLOM|nr:4353_t:CDS:1 [Racocetra persica]
MDDIIYVQRDNNVTFSYEDGFNTFQRGELGLSNSYLSGNLNYYGANMISSIEFYFKGVEEAQYTDMVGRAITNKNNNRILIEKRLKVNFNGPKQIKSYPFKFPLPSNLSSSFKITNKNNLTQLICQINYTLHATIHPSSKFRNKDIAEIVCPLEQVLFRNNTTYLNVDGTHYDPRNNEPLFEYSFQVPEYLSLGSQIFVPFKIKFRDTWIRIVRIEISLKRVTEIFFEKNGTSFKTEHKCHSTLKEPARIINSELSQRLSLSIPRKLDTSYSGMYINIHYKLCIKFLLTGTEDADSDFYLEQDVIVANIKDQTDDQSCHNSVSDQYLSRPHSPDPINQTKIILQEGFDNAGEFTVQERQEHDFHVQEHDFHVQGSRRSHSQSRTSTSSNRENP